MRKTLLALALLASGCNGPQVAPHGFTIVVQTMGVQLAQVDGMRIVFTPVMEGTAMAHFVQPTRGTTFDDGGIMISVDSVTGLLTMTITGDYFRTHALVGTDGADPRLEIEIWTDDTSMRAMPQMRATIVHGAAQVATGVGYFPSWPPVLGESVTIDVPCMMGSERLCTGR
jgi:hypothetical protein